MDLSLFVRGIGIVYHVHHGLFQAQTHAGGQFSVHLQPAEEILHKLAQAGHFGTLVRERNLLPDQGSGGEADGQ